MSDTFWIGLVIIGAIWFFWPRSKAGMPESLTDAAESAPDRKEAKEEQQAIANARRAREQAEQDERLALKRQHKSMEAVRDKLERAKKYMNETGLDRAIPEVWEMANYWPHWVKLPDKWTPPDGVTDIHGGGDMKDARVEFRWDNHHYSMHFVEKFNYLPDDDEQLGEITLAIDGEAVCTIGCAQGFETYDSWRFSGVEALKVGPWMSDFVALASHLRSHQGASIQKTLDDIERDRASRIDLGY